MQRNWQMVVKNKLNKLRGMIQQLTRLKPKLTKEHTVLMKSDESAH